MQLTKKLFNPKRKHISRGAQQKGNANALQMHSKCTQEMHSRNEEKTCTANAQQMHSKRPANTQHIADREALGKVQKKRRGLQYVISGFFIISTKNKNLATFALFASRAGNDALVQGIIGILRVHFVKRWK